MNIIIIHILLMSLCTSTVLLQSNTQLKMSSPGHIGQSVVQLTQATYNITQAPDAKWIWSKGWNKSTCVNPLIIQGDFFVQSGNPITFYVGADDNFTLLVNGIRVMEGNYLYQTNFALSCGIHTFKIISYNNGICRPDNPAGLIFAFVQDTSTFQECYKKLPFVSNTSIKMSSPGHVGQPVVQNTKYTKKILQAPDAMWIWSMGWNVSTCVNPLIIQGDFVVQSGNLITFYVGADDSFTLLIDENIVMVGSDLLKIYQTSFLLSCGIHKFKIIANNAGPCTSYNNAGLIYAFVQDTSTFQECYQKLPFVSNTFLKISSPGHIGQLVFANTYPYTWNISQAPDAIWIWGTGWDTSTCVNPLIIQGNFLVQSGNPITFYVSADDNFTLLVNGIKVMEGNDYQQIYQTNFSLTCGLHTFKIISYNDGICRPDNPGGLIFAFLPNILNNKCLKSIIFPSNTKEVISSAGQSVANTYPYNSQSPGAIWIWSTSFDTSICVNPLIISGAFMAQFGNLINFYMTADNNFTLLIDENIVMQGNDWRKIYQTSFSLSSGLHTFTIISYNFGTCPLNNCAGYLNKQVSNLFWFIKSEKIQIYQEVQKYCFPFYT